MPKMKDLGINVIPETMRPPECLPWTVGPVCVPGGFTRDAGCFPTSCGVSPAAAAFQSTATCVPNSCGMAPEAFQSTATCIPNSCGVAANPAAFQSTATCIPNSCGVACGCTHITNPCLGCTIAITYPCATHTTITVCANLSHCLPHSYPCFGCTRVVSLPCFTHTLVCTGGTTPEITVTPTTPQLQGGGLTRESIAQLKDQLQQQIAQLDEHAKTLGPKTADEIDAREKQLKAELDELATRRSDLKKSK